tara:strand:- start:1874 stop:3265 length:1392 start_codon:yes stop_codon:yes gene_type:complete
MSKSDKRQKFLNFLINPDLNITNTGMKISLDNLNSHLDIIQFKRKFNAMVMGLSNYEYYMSDMLEYYSGNDGENSNWGTNSYLVSEWKSETIDKNDIIYRNNLSDFILNLIINAVESKFADSPHDVSTVGGFSHFYMITLDSNSYHPYRNIDSYFLEEFKEFIAGPGYRKNWNDMRNAGNSYFSEQSYKNIFRNMLDLKIFDLYHWVLEVEKIQDLNDSKQGIYFIKNFIAMNVLKYFYLSEMLLKVLLDTKENIEGTANHDEIIQNDYTPTSGQYKKYNIIRKEFEYDSSDFDTSKSVGMKLTSVQKSNYNPCTTGVLEPHINSVYKIIKDMYFINLFLERNNSILIDDNIQYITNPSQLTDAQKTKIENLGKNIRSINKNITELNLKNLNIEKNYEKKRNMYYITIIFIIIYIFLNLYVIWSGKTDSLLTLNAILVILILLTKFLSLIKKSYQTLVKDLNN